MRIVFLGSPQFAVPSLRSLASHYDVVGVFTQPDRPAGRGKKVRASPVKSLAHELNISIFQPEKIRDQVIINDLRELSPEFIIVAAYGKILSQEILDIPTYGSINIHASLLPRWRGAAPIQAAILHGDKVTGISIMLMDAGMDTGPILSQINTELHPHETSGELSERLSVLGADLLLATLPSYINGNVVPVVQDEEMATYAPLIQKSDGALDFNKSAEILSREIRAFNPWPSSYLLWKDLRIIVKHSHPLQTDHTEIGLVIKENHQPSIVTGDGILVLDFVQPSGKKVMTGEAFLRGSPGFLGSVLARST